MTGHLEQARTPVDWAEIRQRLERADAVLHEALHPSPLRARAIMDARARALAQVPAQPLSGDARLNLVAFRLGTERYAIETRYVREIARLVDLTPVPGAPEFFIGITGLRGAVLAVIDIRRLFNVARHGLTDASRLLVLGAERAEFAIVADQVDGQVDVAIGDLLDPADTPAIQPTHLRGVTRDAMIILDDSALLKDERLYVEATDRHR